MLLITVLQAASGVAAYYNVAIFAMIFLVFYFFIIRPQTKRAKDQQNFLTSLTKGDKVITTGGIYGRIVNIKEGIAILEVDNKVNIKVAVSALSHEFTSAAFPENKETAK